MTENAIEALKIICKNVNSTRDSKNLFEVYRNKNKKFTEENWKEVLEELSSASFILIKDEYIETKANSFSEIEKYEDKKSFVDKLFKSKKQIKRKEVL